MGPLLDTVLVLLDTLVFWITPLDRLAACLWCRPTNREVVVRGTPGLLSGWRIPGILSLGSSESYNMGSPMFVVVVPDVFASLDTGDVLDPAKCIFSWKTLLIPFAVLLVIVRKAYRALYE